ncbi:tripeptide aminopeptidase PepT [Psychroflexus torquis ATCC 700755]|uniref:Peptidase T n=1 Tax=Psychroflexus torquis (strain ATCC 700755 / CIP 106069 / ACAM 623) TaxID=313595 RepID=K4IL15_PSYTT|nr:peptidase T [Psychroflexus torquis]AFU69786.1 tripeptide aminopeptidase PepT [Psychroflexus torquis ATCC 700755]
MINSDTLLNRFLTYIKIDSQSNPNNENTPSTEKQWTIAHLLKEELERIGLQDVSIDDKAYIMATLPSNVDHEVPTVGFVSHFDTSPDFNASSIKPQIHENYDGGDIILNAEKNIILSPDYFEDLKLYKGQTLITTDGTTLLSADDKAGITEIIMAMEYLVDHPEIRHGKLRVGFTPDEEIGRGAHHFDVEKFGAAYAYTMDGSQIGELEYENFNAASATLKFKGISVHPGYAKGKMVNSMYLAQKFIDVLPKEEVPEQTEGYEGFFHLCKMNGTIELTELNYIIRDHDKTKFEARKELFEGVVAKMNKTHGEEVVELEIHDQYYNMKEKVEPIKYIVDIAEQAMKELNITPVLKPIRGGTDGAQLSYKGLPCPNIFAGGHNFHGKFEYVPLESMVKASEVIVKIAELTARR